MAVAQRRIPLSEPVFDGNEARYLQACVDEGWVASRGRFVAEFEALFARRHGDAAAVSTSSGTAALHLALQDLGIGPGDEVIVPALTFAATPYAAMASGALPVFVDVEPQRWTIDPDLVEAAVTPRTRAIMPVHLGQQMADMDRIMEIARRHDLHVVEDCAHAHGQRWRDQGAGCIGDFGSFSHQSTKILTAGEGGTLTTQDERLARRAHSLIDCGRPKDAAEVEYTFGANYRLGELACALLVNGLRRFPAQQELRARLGEHFERLAAGIPGVTIKHRDPRITRWSFYRYIFEIDPEAFAGATNEQVAEALEAEGVPAEVQYPPMSRYDLFQPALSRLPVAVEHADRLDPAKMSFPVAEAAGERTAVYLNECIFRSDEAGVEDAVEAIAKVQRLAAGIGTAAV
jgi:dTDP-4-amino-4,6-dideoxygalactose transaminase